MGELVRQGCMGLPHIHNEYPYRRYDQHNQGFMTGLKSYSVQTIYVTAVNVQYICRYMHTMLICLSQPLTSLPVSDHPLKSRFSRHTTRSLQSTHSPHSMQSAPRPTPIHLHFMRSATPW